MKADALKFAALLLIAIGTGPASSQVWRWSQTAGSNGSSDPHINYNIGMAPSAVGASARALMAEIAKYRDDISGAVTTSGTSTAYTASSNEGMCASPSTTPQDGQLFSFTVHATNGVGSTLQVDNCSAFAIQTSPGTAVGAASLIAGTPYTAKFSVSAGAWILRDYYGSAFGVPLGSFLYSTLATAPNSNFIQAAGQCISTTTYATYWNALGSPASGSCPGGQFAVIDLRGRVTAGADSMGPLGAAGRLTSSSTGCGTYMGSIGAVCANGRESQTLSTSNLPPYTPAGSNGAVTVSSTRSDVAVGQNAATTGGGAFGFNAVSGFTQITSTGSGPAFTGSPQGGSSQPVPSVPPIIAANVFLRVL